MCLQPPLPSKSTYPILADSRVYVLPSPILADSQVHVPPSPILADSPVYVPPPILADSRVYILPSPTTPRREGEVIRNAQDWVTVEQNWRSGAMPTTTLPDGPKHARPLVVRPVLSRLVIPEPAPVKNCASINGESENTSADTAIVRDYRVSATAWDSPPSAYSQESAVTIVWKPKNEGNGGVWDWDAEEADVATYTGGSDGLWRDRTNETRYPDPTHRFWYRALQKLKMLKNYPGWEW